jgi:futalosine hydrolase
MKRIHEFCRMRILVLAATKHEIAPFIEGNKGVDLLITGVGVPATIYHLQKRLAIKNYQLVIQAGIAGAFSGELQLGEVVSVERDCFADLGMEEEGQFIPIFKSPFMNENEFPYTKGWLVNKTPLIPSLSLPLVKGITINKVGDDLLQRRQLISNFNPNVESMEGAALHYVCLQEHVSFLQVRSISNHVGERDKEKWRFKESINSLNEVLCRIVNRCNKEIEQP